MRFTPQRIAASLRRRIRYHRIGRALAGKHALEIGGPSLVFSPSQPNPFFPAVYSLLASLDDCNYAAATVWSQLDAAAPPWSHPRPRRSFLHDAAHLASIPDADYDLLLASHVLEHLANPLKALREWRRVLKPSGYAFLLLPHKIHTFDHRRPDTPFDHLAADLHADTPETDLSHLDQVLALHDLDLDPPAGTPEQFRQRSLRNPENRCLHHHVFSPAVLARALRFAGFHPLLIMTDFPPHIAALCRVSRPDGSLPDS